ncbi:unnamed protein product, partial [marine sediment metagenome]
LNLEPTTTTISYESPNLIALKGYPELQEKEGITISAMPLEITKQIKYKYKCEWVRSRLGELLNSTDTEQDPNVKLTYLVTESPYYKISSNELIFKIIIHNNLERVLRLAGTVVVMQIDGKMINLDSHKYQEFIDGFVIPRQEAEFKIIGPEMNTLPKKCNIALLLYDIITEVDDAGNPKKKTNFEWFFSYESLNKSDPSTITKKIMKLTPREARAMEGRR